jgi:hypothetical protein
MFDRLPFQQGNLSWRGVSKGDSRLSTEEREEEKRKDEGSKGGQA